MPWLPLVLACRTAEALAAAKHVVCKDREFGAMRKAGNTYAMRLAGDSDAAAEARWR